MGEGNKENRDIEQKKNWLEWTVFGVSVLLTISIIGYLGYKTYTHKPSDPEIQVTYRPDPGGTTLNRYHLTIENQGGETAEEVVIELALKQDGKITERSEVHIPFVPQHSKRESWASFSRKPQITDTIMARVVSFRKP